MLRSKIIFIQKCWKQDTKISKMENGDLHLELFSNVKGNKISMINFENLCHSTMLKMKLWILKLTRIEDLEDRAMLEIRHQN